jgi:uncharacterized membrane protein
MFIGRFELLGYDLLAAAATAMLWFGYHFWLRIKLRGNPFYTTQAINARARAAWVAQMMGRPGMEVTAVQTMRNSMMGAVFIGTSSAFLILGILTLSSQQHNSSTVWNALNLFGAVVPELWFVKLLLLLVTFLVSFFCALQSIRVLNHAGYLIAVPGSAHDSQVTPEYVTRLVNRAAEYQGMAIRAYFLAIPLVFWLFGPHFMVAAAAVLIVLLYRFDRARE